MAKPEWGTKRRCPKCGERFYDMNKTFPLTCIGCGHQFEPETVLKSKQPFVDEAAKALRRKPVPVADDVEDTLDGDVLDEDLDIDDDADAEDILEDVIDDDDDVSDVIEKRASDDT